MPPDGEAGAETRSGRRITRFRWGVSPMQGMRRPSSNVEGETMLDRRDIQTLMYCVRVTEISGQWQTGYPVRTPHDLECRLAALLREVERAERASATTAA